MLGRRTALELRERRNVPVREDEERLPVLRAEGRVLAAIATHAILTAAHGASVQPDVAVAVLENAEVARYRALCRHRRKSSAEAARRGGGQHGGGRRRAAGESQARHPRLRIGARARA